MSLIRNVCLVAIVAVAASGCSWFKRDAATARRSCKEERIALDDRSLPPISAPAGLQAPDPRSAVVIPPLNEPEAPRSASDPCLSLPPSYATTTEAGAAGTR